MSKHKIREGTFIWEHQGERFVVIVTKDGGKSEAKWHMSISHRSRDLTYQELKFARYRYLPDNITVAQVFPPTKDFVNLHPYCFHLWEIAPDYI